MPKCALKIQNFNSTFIIQLSILGTGADIRLVKPAKSGDLHDITLQYCNCIGRYCFVFIKSVYLVNASLYRGIRIIQRSGLKV